MQTIQTVVLPLLLVLAAVWATGFIKVNPKTQFFADEFGRSRIFHGVNVVYKAAPFYPPILDKFHPNSSLCEEDFKNLREWGMNVIRLYVAWEGVEPKREQYDQNYLEVLKNITSQAAKHGIYVILDVHQDVWSQKFCGEGVADWVVQTTASAGEKEREQQNQDDDPNSTEFPFPLPFKIPKDSSGYPIRSECVKHAFFEYYLTLDTNRAFQNFYDNVNGTRSSFAKFWSVVASKFKNEANVLAYEIINEPWAGNVIHDPRLIFESGRADRLHLKPFYEEVHAQIRKVDDEHILFYEPTVTDIKHIGFETGPGGKQYDDRQALSYHVYCSINDVHGDPRWRLLCDLEDDSFFMWRTVDSKRIGGGVFLTEFGAVSDQKKATDEITWVLEQADQRILSWTYWQFKYYSDFTTAASPGTIESFYDVNGNLQTEKVKVLTRTYAPAVCGTPTNMTFDIDTSKFELKFTVPSSDVTCQGQPTEIYLSEQYHYKNGFKVTVTPSDAAKVQQDHNTVLLFTNASVAPGSTITVNIVQSA